MGICASCLGLNRHTSQEVDETDALLSSHNQVQYGAVHVEDDVQPDEEEVRREREALEEITARATDDMIDASHPVPGEYGYRTEPDAHNRHHDNDHDDSATPKAETDDEEAWLQSLEADGLDQKVQVKGLNTGALVMDIGQLRQDESARP